MASKIRTTKTIFLKKVLNYKLDDLLFKTFIHNISSERKQNLKKINEYNNWGKWMEKCHYFYSELITSNDFLPKKLVSTRQHLWN